IFYSDRYGAMKNHYKILFFLLIFIVSGPVQAGLKELVFGVYDRNISVKQNEKAEEVAQAGKKSFESAYDWALSASFSHNDSFSANFVSFQSQRTINDAFSLSLAKNFSWGGNFSLSQEVIQYD